MAKDRGKGKGDKGKDDEQNEWELFLQREGVSDSELTEEEKREQFTAEQILKIGRLREQYRNAPESAPLLWRNVPEALWPYKTFREEWLNSPYALTIETLKRRWRDVVDPGDIELYFASSSMRTLERRDVQERLHQQAIAEGAFAGVLAPNVANYDMLALSNYTRLAEIQEGIDRLQTILRAGKIWAKINIFENGVMSTIWGWKDLDVSEIVRLQESLRKERQQERLYQGQATEILELQKKGQASVTVQELIEEAIKAGDVAKFQQLQQVAIGVKDLREQSKNANFGKQLPGRTVDAEIHPKNRDENLT